MSTPRALLVIVAIGLLLLLFGGTLMETMTRPAGDFDAAKAPPAPDYAEQKNWAALPDRIDGADHVPPGTQAEDRQADAEVDVFFLHPTSYLLGRGWNASTDNILANWITDNGILEQQASAFNGAARVFAPRYRQASQGAQRQTGNPAGKAHALHLARSDIERAFEFYLAHYNNGRAFIIASHSQGTTHGKELVKAIYRERPGLAERLIAAYLIGNTVTAAEMQSYLPVCSEATAYGCFLSWNTMLEGGDPGHWLAKGLPVCVNPLSWRSDLQPAGAELNLGSLPLTGSRFIDAPHPALTGARCDGGMLWISAPEQPGYDRALFAGGSYHAYDYKLFYMNIRANVRQRVDAWLQAH